MRGRVTLYVSPEFMSKNQKPTQTNDSWFIPAVPTGNSEFGAPNCPLKTLRYYHRFMSECTELCKGQCRLFIPIKVNNVGKDLSATTISRLICDTILESHATLAKFKSLRKTVKAHCNCLPRWMCRL